MKTIWHVARKELVDLFRDRRTVMIGLLVGPLLFPALILGMGALAEKRARTQLESTLELPVIGAEHAPNLIAFLDSQNIVAKPAPEDPDKAVLDQTYDIILRIDDNFPQQWRDSQPAAIEMIYDSSQRDADIPKKRLEKALQGYGQQIGVLRMLSRGISPSLTQSIQISERDLATPEAKRGALLAFLPYLLLLSAFLGGAYLVIDVTAGERERQTLEPLLATPSSRGAIMSGKILAACLFGMFSLLLILISFKLSFMFANKGAFAGVNVSLLAVAKLLAVLAPMVLFGTTLLTLISASVKSVKEAQSYMSILMLAPILPTLILLVNPVKNALWMFAVPFLSQNQMILKILRSETITAQQWGLYLTAGIGIGAIFWLIASRMYHREKLAISA